MHLTKYSLLLLLGFIVFACNKDDAEDTSTVTETPTTTTELHAAFGEFNPDSYSIMLDGDEIVIETNGMPDHTSPYWSSDNALFVEPTGNQL